ncbi:MAG TPA: cytochrome c1 [Chromatiales bacterium]|nr:cytochrome c1 [Chromatiales bacterium]
MKHWILGLFLLTSVSGVWASGPGVHLDAAPVDVSNTASLQRGAKFFVNYCLTCHSAEHARFIRVAQDLGLSTELVEKYLIFTDAKIRDHMKTTMLASDATEWFGSAPPDLTLIARAKGADYLYTYLRSFYLDDTRPFGVNNRVLHNASMPHVLWRLQGWQKPVYKESEEGKHEIEALELVEGSGLLTPEAYDRVVADLVNFMVYLSEPAQLERKKIGIWVLLYLIVLGVLAYLLKKEYWKDVH